MNKKSPQVIQHFGPSTDFTLVVPSMYDHHSVLDTFREQSRERKSVFCFDDRMSDKNFAAVSHPFHNGTCYCFEFVPIVRMTNTQECLAFLRERGARFVGAQALVLLYQLESRRVGRGKHIVSFDEEACLWSDARGRAKVPVLTNDEQVFLFDLVNFDAIWTSAHEILCVTEI